MTIRLSAASLFLAMIVTTPLAAQEETVELGVLLGFSGPTESLAPGIANGARLAMAEVTDSGRLLGGAKVNATSADSTCTDTGAATVAAKHLIETEQIDGLIGGLCSGSTIAVLNDVAMANGMVMISPSATAHELTTMDDEGLFFRVSPSDARQGEVMAEIIRDRDITEVAVSYTDNDYGRSLADIFEQAFKNAGGTVTSLASHEQHHAKHAADSNALNALGGEVLVVIGHGQGGPELIRASLDAGAFETFVLSDALVSPAIMEAVGDDLDGSFGQIPGTDSEGVEIYIDLASAAGFDGSSPYSGASYDATALMLLAMQSSGSKDPSDYVDHVMTVANAPGIPILPGQLDRALELLAAGEDIDYEGVTDVELIEPGEVAGRYREFVIDDGEYVTVRHR